MTAPAPVAVALTPEGRELLAGALADAVSYRRPEGPCSHCEEQGALCEDHAADWDRADAVIDLATELGLTLEVS